MIADGFLDFYNIIVNQLVGDPTIFIVLALLIVTIILVVSRVPNQVYLIILFAVTAMLAVEFEVLRWALAVGLGYVGWMLARLGRG